MSFIEQKLHKYLAPPGQGIFTSHSIKNINRLYQTNRYGSWEESIVKKAWMNELHSMDKSTKPLILGIPSDAGAGILKGANWGPIAIRNELTHLDRFVDLGDVKCIPHFILDEYLNPKVVQNARISLYGVDNGYPVSPVSITSDILQDIYDLNSDAKVLCLGGDNSISYAAIKSWMSKQKNNFAILHFDAHTDIMKNRLGVEITFGSWVHHVIPLTKNPNRFVQIGTRATQQSADYWENEYGIKQFWAKEVLNSKDIFEKIISYLNILAPQEVYVSIDIDVLDSQYASACGSPEPAGLAPHHIAAILKEVSSHYPITGADLTEVTPFSMGIESPLGPEPETTLLSSKIIVDQLLEVLCL